MFKNPTSLLDSLPIVAAKQSLFVLVNPSWLCQFYLFWYRSRPIINMLLCDLNISIISNKEDKNVVNDGMKIGAFACRKREYKPEFILPDIPLSNLLPRRKEDLCEEDNDLSNDCEELECSKTSTIKDDDQNGNSPTESLVASSTTVSTSDDFIMVDLKTPFASRNANSELGMFYREWQSAPPLKTFTHIPTLAEQVQDLTRQLENFELDMNKYDDMLNSLCQSPNNN